jgi:hypothetical protein
MCYLLNDNTGFSNLIRGGDMRLLRLAVKQERWDLAAHTIVLATARQLKNGEKRNDRRSQEKKRIPKRNRDTTQTDFYTRVLDEAGKLDFKTASGVEGIDEEIALLRVTIKSILEKEPENIRLIMQATNTLADLVKTRYRITKEQRQGLKEAIGNVLRDVAIPLGISVGASAISKKIG